MKKLAFVLVAAMTVFLAGSLRAGEEVSAPSGEVSNPINADYGGVDIFLSSFTTNVSTLGLAGDYGRPGSFTTNPSTLAPNPAGPYGVMASTTIGNTKSRWRIYGAYFSTGNCGNLDYVDVFSATGSWANVNTAHPLRIYNVNGSTGAPVNGSNSACSGFTPLRWPIRMYGNLYFRPSVSTYNEMGILYWKEPD